MKPNPDLLLRFAERRRPLFVGAAVLVLAAVTLQAQQAPVTTTAADLARYDRNGNGVLDADELAIKAEAERNAAAAASTSSTSSTAPDDVVTLSPFEVQGDATGYFQSNAMSGTRLNSKIEDLGQSITVMTKEQMQDFAMLDINDVFDYMAGTEGTNTYSDFVVDRTGAVTDNVSLNPTTANRVRGIGRANVALNNIETTGRVPIDPLWIDSLEVSRGANANIFGLGEAGGTVNQVPATANLTRDFTRFEARGDSDGGWRASIDVNRPLVEGKLAVRASFAHQHTGFQREPSGEDARRQSLQLKARPFANTTLSLSYFNYQNTSQRPNFTTPRDNISSWIAAGRPAWNPITRLITIGSTTYGMGSGNTLVAGSTTPFTGTPTFFNNDPVEGRTILRIGESGYYWTMPVINTGARPFDGAVTNSIRLVGTAPVNSYGAAQPLFASYAAVGDKSLYDYENISLTAANKAWDDVDIYMAQLDQVFLNTQRQTLAGQATYMREDADRLENMPLGPASVNGVIGELYADPNTHNLDGTPNPYFGRPYLRSKEPFLRDRPWRWDTTRLQLAYKLDFSNDSGWTKWLGTQQLLGYYEYKDQENRHYAWRRTANAYSTPYLLDEFNRNAPLGNRAGPGSTLTYNSSNNRTRVYEQYYVGNTSGGGIEYAPSAFPEEATVPFVWGNTGNFRADPLTLGWTPAPDGSAAAGGARQTVVKTRGGTIQSFFLKGKIVTMFGQRYDKVFDRTSVPAVLTPDLLEYDRRASDQWQPDWRMAEGKTKSFSVVLRPFQDLRFLEDQATNGRGVGRFLAQAVRGFSPFYHKGDNFIPQGPAVDLFLNPLPNQTGSTKDQGFWLTLLDNRLTVRYTHYTSDQRDKRDGDIATIAQRVLRADGLNAADRWALQDRSRDWIRQANPSFTDAQVNSAIADTMGLTVDQIAGLESAIAAGRLAATQDVAAKGDELEINFNPVREWTISASGTKSESINQNAGSTIEDWINLRMPVWEAVEDPRFTAASPGAAGIPTGPTGHLLWRYIRGSSFTAAGYDANNSAATNFTTFVEGPLAVYRQLEGRPRPQVSKYTFKFSTRYQLSGITDNSILRNMNVGGSVRWNDKKAIGFLGVQSLPARITALDTNKPVFTPAETYVDLFVSYRTRLFRDKVRANFQFNVRNVGESGGRLLTTQVFPDGTPLAYRIIDPRQFILSASFEL